jgi:hypothetical protein
LEGNILLFLKPSSSVLSRIRPDTVEMEGFTGVQLASNPYGGCRDEILETVFMTHGHGVISSREPCRF